MIKMKQWIKYRKDNHMSPKQGIVRSDFNKREYYVIRELAGLGPSIWRFSFPFVPYAFPSGFSSALSFGFSW
jgi:hypothetical protein